MACKLTDSPCPYILTCFAGAKVGLVNTDRAFNPGALITLAKAVDLEENVSASVGRPVVGRGANGRRGLARVAGPVLDGQPHLDQAARPCLPVTLPGRRQIDGQRQPGVPAGWATAQDESA